MSPKTRKIIGWVLTVLLAGLFLFSASGKFMATPEMLEMGAKMGLTPTTFKVLGVLEVLSLLLFIVPRTGVLGTLLLSAYMGGAIATHLEHGDPIITACVVTAIIWITALIRFPELGTRLFGARMTL